MQGRWVAFQQCVFVNLVSEFEKQHRPTGWLESDFKFLSTQGTRTFFAWTLSEELRRSFRYWLAHDKQPCPEIVKLRDAVSNDSILVESLDSSICALGDIEEHLITQHKHHEALTQTAQFNNDSNSVSSSILTGT